MSWDTTWGPELSTRMQMASSVGTEGSSDTPTKMAAVSAAMAVRRTSQLLRSAAVKPVRVGLRKKARQRVTKRERRKS